MEVITGVAPAEYGDKSSLVVHIVTKSGLDQSKPTGSASFGTDPSAVRRETSISALGSQKVGNFLSLSGVRTDRFLDPPEFEALHDTGHSTSFFDRFDFHPSATDTLHLNVQAAAVGVRRAEHVRHDRQMRQHQDITTLQRGARVLARVRPRSTLFTANGFVRARPHHVHPQP